MREHRRRSGRYPLRWKAAIVFDRAQGIPTLHTRTLDLSTSGAAVFSDCPDLTGSTINLLLAPPARDGGEPQKVLKARAKVVTTQRAPGMAQYRHGLSFIRSPGDGLESLLGWMNSTVAKEATSDVRAPISRLARLKQLAAERATEGRTVDPQERSRIAVSEALGRACRYLKEFAEQANVVRPAYSRGYGIAGVPEFKGLAWDTGYADFHMREVSADVSLNERVTLRFQLSANTRVRVEREYPAADRLRQLLEDSGIEFHAHGVWSKRGSLERTAFDFPCEVPAHLLLEGQFDSGKVLLRSRNVSGFGSFEQILAPDAITDDSLDELAGFILCETTALGPLLLRGA